MQAPGLHLALAALTATLILSPIAEAQAGKWQSLFNGKDLSGWTPKITGYPLGENFGNTFRVENGLLVVRYDAYEKFKGRFGHLFCNTEFSDYRLRVEYRFVGEQVPGGPGWAFRNSGLMVHGQAAETMTRDQKFPVSIEVQLLGGRAEGKRSTANLCTPGTNVVMRGKLFTRHCTNSSSATYRGDRWVTAEIEVIGNRIRHFVEGKMVLEYTDPQLDPRDSDAKKLLAAGSAKMLRRGTISLQSESHPCEFRKVEILNLSAANQPEPSDPGIKLPEGFRANTVYRVPRDQGSWVSLCVDDKQRLIACDQHGSLYRVTLAKASGKTAVTQLDTDVGHAQGLLHAFGSLYVMGRQGKRSGLFRLTDTTGDDQYDKVEHFITMPVGGEHQGHAIVLSPDGKSLYICAGNMTRIPQPNFTQWRMRRNFASEDLVPRMPDARGHNTGAMAIGGWIARISPDGKQRELISNGYRNQYDIAFNEHGELFTYDSDMEWDIGTPWYRPTRVCHVTSGSEFGWRYGTGKWPSYSPDTLPSVVDIGPGSPTGVTFGLGTKFPARYQKAMFVCDWSYGIIYAVHMQPQGSSYVGTKEAFAIAAPFPVTDIVVHPDGALYLTVGGRNAGSALYKIAYHGAEATTPIVATADAGSTLRKLRRQIEATQTSTSPEVIETAIEQLNHEDRHIRFAARIAMEKQPVELWRNVVMGMRNYRSTIHGVLAVARRDKQVSEHYKLLEKLVKIDIADLFDYEKLELLRTYGVVLWRMRDEMREYTVLAQVADQLDNIFPDEDPRVNMELCRVLSVLNHRNVARKSMQLLAEAPTQEEQLHYAYCLRIVLGGWTRPLRDAYFQWFHHAMGYRGGASFQGFCRNIRNDAIKRLPDHIRTELADLLKNEPKPKPVTITEPSRKFVKAWTAAELTTLIAKKTSGHDFARGRKMFGVAACARCHRLRGEGGAVGPDLTGLGGRFGVPEILESILEPSKVISDQYQATVFSLTRDRSIVGYVANHNGGITKVVENMFEPGKFTNLKVKDIVSMAPSPVSMMPGSLLMILTAEEIQDLVAYLRSGGDPEHKLFRKQ